MALRLALALAITLVAAPQTRAPAAVARGHLLECETGSSGGELSLRTATHEVYRFTFDSRTYFERENQRSSPDRLRKGDLVEVVSDSANETALRYARTVHVLQRQEPPRRPPLPPGGYSLYRDRGSTEHLVPLGNLTFAGMVCRIDNDRLVMRPRSGADRTIVLREDTRYLEDGQQVAAATLKPNTRVFVRGARNLDDEVEAYQVVWGRILEPGKRP